MKTPVLILTLGLAVLLAGCGPSKAERERQRLELEQRAEQERRIGNEALREVGNKLGRKPPTLDLGVPAEPVTPAPQSTQEQSKEP